MKKPKEILKKWMQDKIAVLNARSARQLERQFAYHCRVETLNNYALNSTERSISDEKHCKNEIVVSLTTYGRRLYEVYLTIESIMQQSLKPNKIVLWLGEESKKETLPIVLQKQQKRGLEIKYCKDIKSYTKLIPSLRAFPSSAIITVDDDHLYHFALIENIVNAYIKNPGHIYCTRMHRMKLLSSGILQKYSKWEWDYNSFDISPLNFPTGVGGVLYPPHCFNEEVFNEKTFMSICEYADDIWFKAMALMNNVPAQKIYIQDGDNYNLENRNVQNTRLSIINTKRGMNDIQLNAVFNKYNLYEKLKIPKESSK